MAYRGNGSSDNPAIPGASQGTGTITDLLQIIADANAGSVSGNTNGPYYIKLDSDIDCYDDPNYIGYTSALSFLGLSVAKSITKLYSDTGHYIRGLTVKDTLFMKMLANNQTAGLFTLIENVSFIDCFFKPTGGTCSFVNTATNNYGCFVNSKISVNMYTYGSYIPPFGCAGLNGCSVYLKYNGTGVFPSNSGKIFESNNSSYTKTTKNVFIVDNLTLSQQHNNGQCLFTLSSGQDNYNAFIVRNSTLAPQTSNILDYYLIKNGSYNYVALVNPSSSSSIVGSITLKHQNSTYTIFGVPSYGTGVGEFNNPGDTANVISYATLTDLKDYTYLSSKNFIP